MIVVKKLQLKIFVEECSKYGLFNEPAIKAFKKCGFKEIGRRRKAIIYGTQEYDEVFMDILNDEFHDSIICKILDK